MKLSQLLNKPTPSVARLAKKYKTTAETVQAELQRGIRVEMEHTNKPQVAREIALDHLGEDLHYYEKLSNMEKNKVQEQELLELFDLNKPPQGVEGPNLRGTIGGKETYYKFAVDDKKYFVTLYKNRFQHVEIVFSDEQGNVGLTNTGNATKVFWSVAQCLVDYLERHPSVQNIYFTSSSNEPSRIRLYSLLSKRLAQELGWHASSKKPSPPAHPDVDYYVTKEPLRSLDENSLLVELFDLNKVPEGVTPPQMESDVTDKTIYQFRVGGRKYLCQFTDVDRDTYDLKFKDPEGRMSITGAGEATKVFWSVARAVSMFIQHKSVALLRFGASEPSRQKLYNVLSKRLADTLGWTREIVTHPSDPATYFRLHNPNYQS